MWRIALIVLGLACTITIHAQPTCNSRTNLLHNLIASRPVSDDGYIHIYYNFGVADLTTPSPHSIDYDPSPSSAEVQAAANAVQEWNNYKDTTAVVFEQTSGPSDIQFNVNTDANENQGCIGSNAGLGDVNFGNTFIGFMNAPGNLDMATTAFAHEIGHLLGMNDDTTSTNSIMTHGQGTCGSPVVVGPPTVQDADAQRAGQCIATARGFQTSFVDNSGVLYWNWFGGSGTCTTYYQETDWYFWTGENYIFERVEYDIVGSTC